MLEIDTKGCLASLEKYKLDLEKRLKTLVHRTVSYWASGVVEITPVGDSLTYRALYQRRPEGWATEEGLLMGNWRLRNSDVPVGLMNWDSSRTGVDTSGRNLTAQAESFKDAYKLGDTITLYNATPYANEVTVRGSRGSETVPVKADALAALMNTYKYAYSALT